MMAKCMSRERVIDILLIVLVASIAFSITLWACQRERELGVKPVFYQEYYEPAIRMACGQRFGVDRDGQLSQPMLRFLSGKQDTLSPADVNTPVNFDSMPVTSTWYHLFVATALVWKFTGISWTALDGVVAGMMAISAVFVMLLFRLFMPTVIAVLLSIASIWTAMPFLHYHRDMNKAPFIVAAVYAATWLVVRAPPRGRAYGVVAAIATWLGIGYGFRPDVVICLPFLMLTFLFFREDMMKRWYDGLLMSALLVFLFSMVAWPAVNPKSGNGSWHCSLLGLSDYHSGLLDVTPGPYSWLSTYNDGLEIRTVETYSTRIYHVSDIGLCTPNYDRSAKELFIKEIFGFPADFMTRAMAASEQVIGSGWRVVPWSEHPLQADSEPFLLAHRVALQDVWIGLYLVVLLVALAWNVRVGLFFVFALAYMSSYPIVQFELRHFFHLSFLTLLPIGIVAGWMVRGPGLLWRRHKGDPAAEAVVFPPLRAWLRAGVLMALIPLCIMLALAYARQVQYRTVSHFFDRYLEAKGEVAAIAAETVKDKRVVLKLLPPDSAGPSPVNGHMLRLDIDSHGKPLGNVVVSTALGGPLENNEGTKWKKDFSLDFDAAHTSAILFVPIYAEKGKNAEAVFIELPQRDILANATWLNSEQLPAVWLWTKLYPDWRTSKLYFQLKGVGGG